MKKMKMKKIVLSLILMNLILVLAVAQTPEEEPSWCCLENLNGQYCREYPVNDISNYCDTNDFTKYHRGSCEEASSFCQPGCCYNSQKQCITGSVQLECESNEGSEWFNNAGCNLQQCQQGCCVLGSQVIFTTSEGCDLWSASQGLPQQFFLGMNPGECYNLVGLQAQGACIVNSENDCIFTTKEQCLSQTNDITNFYEGYLCSNPTLNTPCEPQSYTNCIEGKHEVYWFDSCGNRENIYGTSNDGGLLKTKTDSCVLDLNSNQASCGNCDIGESICGLPIQGKDVDPIQGDYVCRDMRCIDEEGDIRDNGESWCVYEGSIEDGKDVVGSSHWRYYCQNGEVKSENCDERREKVCAQEIDDNGFTSASCINNEWERCLDYNLVDSGLNWIEEYFMFDGGRIKECDENEFCYVKRVYLGGAEIPGLERYAVCAPRWPVGFDLESDAQKEAAIETCGMGSKRMLCFGDYGKCVSELNDLCISMGDCGAYVNYKGEYTEDGVAKYYGMVASSVTDIWNSFYSIPDSKINEYISNSEPDLSQAINVEDLIPGNGNYDRLVGTTVSGSGITGGSTSTSVTSVAGTLYVHPLYKIKFTNYKWIPGFNCLPWQAPIDGICEDCSSDPLKPCTPYRCQSTGKNCKLINQGSEYELCFRAEEYDFSPPIITPLADIQTPGLSYRIYPNVNGYQLWNNARSDGCIQAHSEIQFGIETDEPAVCRFSRISVDYSPDFVFTSLPELFGEHNYLDFNHTLNTSLPSIEEMANYYEVDLDYTRQNFGMYNYYIRCEDAGGKSNINEYLVKLCVNPEPDIQAPSINAFMPAENTYFKYGISESSLNLWVNEQADCRYTENPIDMNNYDSMSPMECRNNFTQKEIFGWRCSTTLTGISNNKKYYFLCKDKPWLEENNETRITMSQGKEYSIRVTENPLTISSKTINSQTGDNIEVFSNTNYASISLDVVTSGGANNGEPICYWKMSESAIYNEFRHTKLPTTPNNHRQVWSYMNNGTHNIYVYCVDNVGNNASEIISFTVSKDTDAPVIVRMYYQNELKIMTNEDAECRYSNNFTDNWGNKTLMSSSDNRWFNAPWYEDRIYYIQCEDDYANRISMQNQVIIASYEINTNL